MSQPAQPAPQAQTAVSDQKDQNDAFDDIDNLCIKTIGILCADMVEKASSGHPGAPMGLAAVSHVLFSKILNASSSNSSFINRDRFILSNGHACSLQYAMLHLCGYKITLNDLKSFRQLNSITPGHPENTLTDGIEVSTGPLGQGLAQSVGMAIAQKYLSSTFTPDLFNHFIYAYCGDGCMQEGVSSEACSLAGHLKLNNLIVLYDDNNITIDGNTNLSFTESVPDRFRAYGWNVLSVNNGNTDLNEIYSAIIRAKSFTNAPTLICIKTIIGYGSIKANTHGVHGSKLGSDALSKYKIKMGFDPNQSFVIDDKVYKRYLNTFIKRGKECEINWNKLYSSWCNKYPSRGLLLNRLLTGKLADNWTKCLPKYDENSNISATRNINGEILNCIANVLPEIIGGSADLTPSTKTLLKCSYDFQGTDHGPDKLAFSGRYLRFGVREFAMFAIGNGISSYGCNMIPFTSTFLNFLTYGYGAVRLGALSHLRHIYIMTHDSILLGEDGPTHQPVEVIAAIRAIPNLITYRPADGNEICSSWKLALNYSGPSVICLSRQKVDVQLVSKYTKSDYCLNNMKNGLYILSDMDPDDLKTDSNCDCIIIATGSEVGLALSVQKQLKINNNYNIRVISGLSLELFNNNTDLNYKKTLFQPKNKSGKNTLVVSIEASSSFGWCKYSHKHFGVDTFGLSAPLSVIRNHFGFNIDKLTSNIDAEITKWKDKQIPLLPCLYG